MQIKNELIELIHKQTGIVLSNRVGALLVNGGIRDLKAIAELTWSDARKIPEFGDKAWKEIEAIQAALNLEKRNLTQELSDAINSMLEASNAIAEITGVMMNDLDIRYVDLFKDVHKSPLIKSADEIEVMVGPTANNIRRLALVLYVKDIEGIQPVGDWRSLVETRPVEAIRILRTDVDKLDLAEAKMVIDAYKLYKF